MKFLMPASMIWNLLVESHTAKQMQDVLTKTFRTEIAILLICKGGEKPREKLHKYLIIP